MTGPFSDCPIAMQPWASQIESRRMQIGTDPNCHFVSWAGYCKLLISTLRLERISNEGAKLTGLREPATGICYFVEHEKIEVRR